MNEMKELEMDRYHATRASQYRRTGTGWVIVFRPAPGKVRVLSGTYPDHAAAVAATTRLNAADRATRGQVQA